MDERTLVERLEAPGPKRILSLDGGGLRGLISLGYLREIERILRDRAGRQDLVLADYFDLIGGTSTGAIIATLLALGRSVREIHQAYTRLGRDAFQRRRSLLGPLGRIIGPKFAEQPLRDLLHEQFGERTLGSEDLRTALVVVTKRADTASVWPLTNVPTQKYFAKNKELSLQDVVTWSAAAPTYFRPQRFKDAATGLDAVFVDGGLSMHNNPAVQLLMVANLAGFGLRWPLGEDRILLCSIGTGAWEVEWDPDFLEKANNVSLLATLTVQLMHDANEMNRILLQWMSDGVPAQVIDRQIGDLRDDALGPGALLTYRRYDVTLDEGALGELGLEYDGPAVHRLRQMSDVRNVEHLDLIGRQAASRQVESGHLPSTFDPVLETAT